MKTPLRPIATTDAHFNERTLRTALGRFASGITIVTTRGEDGCAEGMTANAFSALSLDPPLILWCLRKATRLRRIFERCEYFAVNVLSAEQRRISSQFAKPASDKFADVEWYEGLAGIPLIAGCLAHFECRRQRRHFGGDHVVFIGQIERFGYRQGEPLLFSAGSYAVPAAHPDDDSWSVDASEFADLLL